MIKKMNGLGTVLPTLLFLFAGCRASTEKSPLRFEVVVTDDVEARIAELGLEVPVTGRVFVILSRDGASEPRQQTGILGVPLWGKDVWDLRVGESVIFADQDPTVRGYILKGIGEIPPGDYFVQAFLNVYTTFHRADGHTLEMHLNSGAHQALFRSPGNAYSEPAQIHIDPVQRETIRLTLDQIIPPARPLQADEVLQQGLYDDTEWVKYIKIKSEKVSEFWGRDMYIGANVLLPEGYEENPDVYYPVLYMQGHSFGFTPAPWSPTPWFREGFTIDNPGVDNQLDGFFEAWTTGALPKMIVVTFRDSNPFFDTAYSINTANIGPYGDAVMEELIPYLEENFRIIREPWARMVAGRSTGGYEAAALMVWHPDFFGGTWVWAPDPLDFRKFTQINIYEDKSAFYREYAWLKVERPRARDIDGLVQFTVRNAFDYDQATGDKGRSGGQFAAWDALYSPVGTDGYPRPLWDPATGEIDREVAEYWGEHYDVARRLKNNWSTLGPKLRGKLHFAAAITDNRYLNESLHLLQEFLESTTDPPAEASFQYGWRAYHSWIGYSPIEKDRQMTYAEFISVLADYMTKTAPEGADSQSWKY